MTRVLRHRGQSTLEAVLVLPLTVVMGLVLIQLSLVAQARIMTEYAAFQAARAGIVWNGHRERMVQAALWALAPTWRRSDGLSALFASHALFQALERAGKGLVRVQTLAPIAEKGSAWEELDFDVEGGEGPEPLLSIRLHYDFPLRVPLGGQLLFLAWMAVGGSAERERLWRHAQRTGPWKDTRFLLPLQATYSMQMQSNFFRKWGAAPLAQEKP